MPKVKGIKKENCPVNGCLKEFSINWDGGHSRAFEEHVRKVHQVCEICGYVGVKVRRHKAAAHA